MMLRTQFLKEGLSATDELITAAHKAGMIRCHKKQLPNDDTDYTEFLFKPLEDNSPEPSVAFLLSYILTGVIGPTRCASDQSSTSIQNQQSFYVAIYIEKYEQSTLDEFEQALLFICNNNLVTALKNKIGSLTPEALTARVVNAIEKADESYSRLPTAGTFAHAIDIFGINKTIRHLRIANRFATSRKNGESDDEALLILLNDESTGKSLRSFRYALASALLNVKVDNDKDAARLIDLARNELARKITHSPALGITRNYSCND